MQGFLTYDQITALDPDAFKRQEKKAERDELKREWLRSRLGCISGSTVEKLFTSKLAIANSRTRQKYIIEKVTEATGVALPQASGRAIDWGNKWEPFAVIEYMERTGKEVLKWGDGEAYDHNGKTWQSDGQEFLKYGHRRGTTPDGYVMNDCSLQVKCPHNPANHMINALVKNADDFRELSPNYYAQVQMEMRSIREKIFPVEKCDFVSFDPRRKDNLRLVIIEIPYNADFQETLQQAIDEAAKEIDQLIEKLGASS